MSSSEEGLLDRLIEDAGEAPLRVNGRNLWSLDGLREPERLTPAKIKLNALVAVIDASPMATVVTDCGQPDNPIVAVNEAFTAMTGYTRDEVVGRNCRFLQSSGSEPEARASIRRAIAEGRPAIVETWNYRKDGSPFRNAIMIAPVHDDSGTTRFFFGSQMELEGLRPQGIGANLARRRVLALTSQQRSVLKRMKWPP